MIDLDEANLSILETKSQIRTKSNAQGIQRVLFFLQQQYNKEQNTLIDTSSMLRSKRQIVETRKQEILEGLMLEHNRLGLAVEDATSVFQKFSKERLHLLFLVNVYLQKQEMILVHAKNKFLLRAPTDFARQIMEDVAINPEVDSSEAVVLNAAIFSCQHLTKRILQQKFIQFSDLTHIQTIAYFNSDQLSSPLLLHSFFQLMIIYLEKQASFLTHSKQENDDIPPLKGTNNQAPNMNPKEPQDYLPYLEASSQLEVLQVLIPLFFPLLDIALNQISVDNILETSYLMQQEEHITKSPITHLSLVEEEVLTLLTVLIPSGMQALVSLLQILLELLTTVSHNFLSTPSNNPKGKSNASSQSVFPSNKQFQKFTIILLVWNALKSNVINPVMKWMNLFQEFGFGRNGILTILSKALIGHQSVRSNLLEITHLFYHIVLYINPLMTFLKEQQKVFQLQQLQQKKKQQQQKESLNMTTAGLRKTMMRSSVRQQHSNASPQISSDLSKSFAAATSPAKTNANAVLNQDPAATTTNTPTQIVNPIFQLFDMQAKEGRDSDGAAEALFQTKLQFDSFVLHHLEPLLQTSLELVEVITQQNSMKVGPLGHLASLSIADPYYFQVFDHELMACANLVTDFYSQDIPDRQTILANHFYYEDGIDTGLVILKEFMTIIPHRYRAIFVCQKILKSFLAAIGFYVNYYQYFSFEDQEYSIYQDLHFRQELIRAAKTDQKRKAEVKQVKKMLIQRSESPLRELSSTTTDPMGKSVVGGGNSLSLAVAARRKRNAFANELGQFAYRVLGMMMLHHSSLNLCHKGLLYLRYAMREQFLEKHIIEDLFSLPLHTMVDPWLVALSLGIDDDDEEEEEALAEAIGKEGSRDFSRSNTTDSFHEGSSSYESKNSGGRRDRLDDHDDHDDESVNTFATQNSKLFPATKHMPPAGVNHSTGGMRVSPSPSIISHDASDRKDEESVASAATSVTTKTTDLNPTQYLQRMKRLYLPKTFQGETKIKRHKSDPSAIPAAETMTLMDILVFISENHIQSSEVMEQLLLIVYQITTKSNLIKYLLVENNLPLAIQRFSENQSRDQIYLIALCELCLEALKI